MNRRNFLRVLSTGPALAAAGYAAAGCGATQRRRRDVRISASSALFRNSTLEDACGRIGGVDFEAIDLWGAEGCRHLEDAEQRLGADGLRELLSRNGLRPWAFTIDPGTYDRHAAFIGELGGGVIVQSAPPGVPPSELSARMRDFIQSLQPAADLAASHNSRIAVINGGGSLLNTLDSIKAFTDLNSHPNLGIALAPYHLQAIGVSVPEAIHTAGSQLQFFHAWQYAQGLRQLPLYGPADFRPWFDALSAVKYPGYVNAFMRGYVEPDSLSAALARVRNYLLHPA